MFRALALLLPILAGSPETNMQRVAPGAVATVSVALPSSGPARYRIAPADGIRFMSGLAGETLPGARELPVTFAIDRGRMAGPMTAGFLVLERDGGPPDSLKVEVYVSEKREIRLEVLAARATIAVGNEIDVRVLVRNGGNAPDTVTITYEAETGFSVPGLPRTVELQPGQEIVDVLRVQASARVAPGPPRTVVFAARGLESTAMQEIRLTVTDAPDADRVYLPATFFLGSGNLQRAAGSLPSFAASVAGEIGGGTRLNLSVHQKSETVMPVAFQPYLPGAGFRLGIGRGTWSADVGDVAMYGSGLSGQTSIGTGLHVRGSAGATRIDALVANPVLAADGEIMRARLGRQTSFGLLGARIGSEPALFGGEMSRHALVTYSNGLANRHQVEGEAGLIARGDAAVLGGETTYRFRGEDHAAFARLRRVGRDDDALGIPANEIQGGVDLRVFGGFKAQGGVSVIGAPPVGSLAGYRDESVTGGVSWFGGATHLTATSTFGRYLTREGMSGTARSAAATASIPVGSWTADLRLETAERPTGRFSTAQTGLRRAADGGWLQASASYTVAPFSQPGLRLDLGGELEIRQIDLRGGFGSNLSRNGLAASAGWGGIALPIARRTELILGAEYRPWSIGSSPWVVSLGVQRRSSIPLPRRDPPVTRGTVFEDRNGNGRQDAEDVGIADLVVRTESAVTVTAADGSFTLPRSGERIVVDGGGRWFLEGAEVRSEGGTVVIPASTAASLHLELYSDDDGSGERADVEAPVEGVLVKLTDKDGRVRSEVSDSSGNVHFPSLRPGTYAVVLFGRMTPAGVRTETTFSVDLACGQQVGLALAAESPRPEIRMSQTVTQVIP